MDESVRPPCENHKNAEEAVHMQAEIDHLRQHLAERDNHIVALETECLKGTAKINNLEEQLTTWRDKYERLYDSHKRVQKLNQVLEDKLLQMVDKMKSEKSQLTKDIGTLSVRLAESKHTGTLLQKENERYKNDMNLAIQLLQCKPDNFVPQKLDNLPLDTQTRVSQFVMLKTKPLNSTLPKNSNDNDVIDPNEYEFNISASLMSKILEDSVQDTITKHCDTCTCNTTHSKPFAYHETHYSVATQTILNGESKNSLCLNCNADINFPNSNISNRSNSPRLVKIASDNDLPKTNSDYINEPKNEYNQNTEEINNIDLMYDKHKLEETDIQETCAQNEIPHVGEDFKQLRKKLIMEPAVHHRLCEKTKSSNYKDINNSPLTGVDLLTKESLNSKEEIIKSESIPIDTVSLRKNSQSSTGAISRTSSIAKSTSTYKSNTHVGPGPRFCSLRLQAGSKNILLDNAQPDVPPILYTRQNKCNENLLFKDSNDLSNFITLEKNNEEESCAKDNVVVESTLVDVHVDNSGKDLTGSEKSACLNPILFNVSSSPLQPLKTHTNSNSSENKKTSFDEQKIHKKNDNFFNEPILDMDAIGDKDCDKTDTCWKKDEKITNCDGVKIFNFDQYEQNFFSNQYSRSLVSQIHSLEKTKISKDLTSRADIDISTVQKILNTTLKSPLPTIVNVYPNLTQTHLKVNDTKNAFKNKNEQSTSSLSSDDSAALLQKQQLLRVAEWVEQNLEQQNNLKDPIVLEDDFIFNHKIKRRDSKSKRNSEDMGIVHKMPHPVTKYSSLSSRDESDGWNLIKNTDKQVADSINNVLNNKLQGINNISKETIFPAEYGDSWAGNDNTKKDSLSNGDIVENQEVFNNITAKEVSAEELARMEYNVKQFLLNGPHWVNPNVPSRSRRTSSKTETDV